jgi:hypothetical protein
MLELSFLVILDFTDSRLLFLPCTSVTIAPTQIQRLVVGSYALAYESILGQCA